MLEVLAHSYLPHQFVLVPIHPGQLADMCEYVLQTVRQLKMQGPNYKLINLFRYNRNKGGVPAKSLVDGLQLYNID